MNKLFTIVCFAGLSSPIWFGLLLMLALNAYAPGFRNDPPTYEELRHNYYEQLPHRIKLMSDSIKNSNTWKN